MDRMDEMDLMDGTRETVSGGAPRSARRGVVSALRFAASILVLAVASAPIAARRPAPVPRTEAEWRFRIENALVHHGYSIAETAAGLGIAPEEARAFAEKAGIALDGDFAVRGPVRTTAPDRIVVHPWAPGRHPRLGFLDGAVDPWADTKLSVFPPWKDGGFVVFDLPEAVFSNLGLLYLAHTHVPTIWEERGVELEPTGWERWEDGSHTFERLLPNGVKFGVVAKAAEGGGEALEYRYWLENGTDATLTGLRSQLCVLLGNAPDFNEQTADNKLLLPEFGAAAARSRDGKRWIVTACAGDVRPWQNPPCPCIHADPTFPDCPPGERVETRGRLFFFEGEDVRGEIARRHAEGRLVPSEGNPTMPIRSPEGRGK